MTNKKKTLLGVLGLGVVAIGLSSCTNTLCSNEDISRMMYAFDVFSNKEHVLKDGEDPMSGKYTYGITTYYDTVGKPEDAVQVPGMDKVFYTRDIAKNKAITAINTNAVEKDIRVNNYEDFWALMDDKFLDAAIEEAGKTTEKLTLTVTDINEILLGNVENNEGGLGYLKFFGSNDAFWTNWNATLTEVKVELGVNSVPDSDYVNFYQSAMTGYVSSFRSCLATTDGFYGYYGIDNDDKIPVYVAAKDWGYAFSRGFIEGLLIFPIGWFIDITTSGFLSGGIPGGWAQALAILIVTIIIRVVMMLVTINQTLSNARMSEVQPEIAKIQAKYPNANTNKNEQQLLAQETQALYKKNKIHPFLSMLVMIVQFPIFIAVWGAMTGSAILASSDLMGLRLSDSVSSVLTPIITSGFSTWPSGWITAIVLFLVMAALQIVSMLLPQWITKRKAKAIAKTGKNPNVKSQDNKMKWFTIIMMVFIIFMGFTLASGMVIYWIAGSIWAIAQALIIEWINHVRKNRNRNKKSGKKVKASAGGKEVDAEVVPEHMVASTGKRKFKDRKDNK